MVPSLKASSRLSIEMISADDDDDLLLPLSTPVTSANKSNGSKLSLADLLSSDEEDDSENQPVTKGSSAPLPPRTNNTSISNSKLYLYC